MVIGDFLPPPADIFQPVVARGACLGGSAAVRIFRVVPFEKLVGVALDAIELPTAPLQMNVRVIFFVVKSHFKRVLVAAKFCGELARCSALLNRIQFNRQGKFCLVINISIRSLEFVGRLPKLSWIFNRPDGHISTQRPTQLSIMALGETPLPHDVIMLVDTKAAVLSATMLDVEMINTHGGAVVLALAVFARRRCALFFPLVGKNREVRIVWQR